jgi:DNA ligase-associated putative exonuclease
MRVRLPGITLQTLAYGEALRQGDVTVSLHPAGHVLGSAQLRIEHRGEVWVASGDYFAAGERDDPREHNRTCAPFEPVRCHCFITESTFGLPIYRWAPQDAVFAAIDAWWAENARNGRASVLFAYALGKAQRVLAGIDSSIGPLIVHGAVDTVTRAYRAASVALPATQLVTEVSDPSVLRRCLVIAPPSAQRSPWLRRFGDLSDAFASGWMQVRGARRRRSVDRGFVLSDHADWPGLLRVIAATGRVACDRHPWFRGRDGALARRARVRGGRVRDGVRRPRRRPMSAKGRPSANCAPSGGSERRLCCCRERGGRDPMKRFAALYADLDATTATNEKVAALTRYFRAGAGRGRRLGGVLPRRRQAATDRADAAHVRARVRARRHRRVALRSVVRGGRRFRGDRRARIAAARRTKRLGLAEWVTDRLLPLRGADPATQRARSQRIGTSSGATSAS